MPSGIEEGGRWDVTWYTDRDWSETFEVYEDERALVPATFSPGTTAVASIKAEAGGPVLATVSVAIGESPAVVTTSLSEALMPPPGEYWWDCRKTEDGVVSPFIVPSRFVVLQSITEVP